MTLQTLQITTLSHLNATAISKETGCIFHHRRGARFRAREASASCLALFLGGGVRGEVLSRNSFTAVGQAFIKAKIEARHYSPTPLGTFLVELK